MRHIMVAISGFSGVGKDECAGRLVRDHGAVHTGLADPAKRHMMDLYGFSYDQLWGPSHFRNAGDPRYPKNNLTELDPKPCGTGKDILELHRVGIVGEVRPDKHYVMVETRDLAGADAVPGRPGWPAVPCLPTRLGSAMHFVETDHPNFFLSPREALQLYCNLMNDLHLNTWARKGVDIQKQLAETIWDDGFSFLPQYSYARQDGLVRCDISIDEYHSRRDPGRGMEPSVDLIRRHGDGPLITVFSDFRHRHEIRLARQMADTYVPVMVRVKHPKILEAPYQHRSELEQASIPDGAFDFIIENDGTLEELYAKVDDMIRTASDPAWAALSAATCLGNS